MPLSQIKRYHKIIYEKAAKKYEGREDLLKRIIPKLNCYWNDVLFFSPIHPQKLKNLFNEVELKWKLFDWYEFNPNDISDFTKSAVIYNSIEKQKGDFSISESEIIPFSLNELKNYQEIPETAKRYYNSMKALGERIFIFNMIPQILYKGVIPLAKLKKLSMTDLSP